MMTFKIHVILDGFKGTKLFLGKYDGDTHGQALKKARTKYPQLDQYPFSSKPIK